MFCHVSTHKLLNMELLPSINIESRKKWIKALYCLSKKRGIPNAFYFARFIENVAHCRRQKTNQIIEGINVMRYGNVEVLNLSDAKIHIYHATVCYTNFLRRLCFAIYNGFLSKIPSDPNDFLNATDEQVSEGSLHNEWEKSFFEKQELARKILQDKKTSSTARGIFACPKCKSFDVDTEQKQTRSADEPMTNFCTCNNCGKKFVN